MAMATQADLRRMQITRRIVYVLVALAVIVPYLLRPEPLPFEPADEARDLYERLDALDPGGHVLISFDFDPASQAELLPMGLSLIRHCFRKDLIPIVMTHWPGGVGLCKQVCERASAEAKELWGKEKISGRDFVFLGIRPGQANLVLKMGENLKGAFEKDYYGKPTRGMAALEGVDSLKDLDFIVDLAAGATVGMWISYATDLHRIPFGVGTTAVQAPNFYPYLQSGQMVGFLGGMRGAADYEQMIEKPGDANKGMHSQSVTHLLIILLVLGANVQFVASRLRRKREE